MDNSDEQHQPESLPESSSSASTPIISSQNLPLKASGIEKVFPTFVKAAKKLGLLIWTPKRRGRVLAFEVIVLAVVVFFGGYNLAVYQEENSKSLLPHFTFGNHCEPGTLLGGGCADPYCGGLSGCSSPPCAGGCSIEDEPVVYLYPTHTEKVNVKVSYVTGLSRTVPNYNAQTGWDVLAQPNGTLTNSADAKTYPYLIWEGNPAPLQFDMSTGFVVPGGQTNTFFQKQLAVMGLNQSEIDAFTAYWLPRMQQNPYNLIHFAGSEYTKLALLQISPQPDSLLRVSMAFERLQAPVKVSPQTFPAFHRTGFTAVEWGGTDLSQTANR